MNNGYVFSRVLAVLTTVNVWRENNLKKLEALLDIIYVASELSGDDYDEDYKSRPRPKRAASGQDDAVAGSNPERLLQLSRLMKKCCRSCTAEDLSGMCPSHSRNN